MITRARTSFFACSLCALSLGVWPLGGCEALFDGGPSTAREERREKESRLLAEAAETGDLRQVALLLGRGYDPNRNAGLYNALHNAANNGHVAVVRYLLEHGSEADARTGLGDTALFLASQWGHLEVMEALVAHGAQVDARTGSGERPLHKAALFGQPQAVRWLVQHGADPNAPDKQGAAPLHYASGGWRRRREVALLLCDLGATTGSALLDAVVLGDSQKAERILDDQPQRISDTDSYGWGPLHWAAATGQLDTVRLLIPRGADLNLPGKSLYGTPLTFAIGGAHLEVVQALVDAGAEVTAKGREACPLAAAAAVGDVRILRILTEHGAAEDLEANDALGMTPLHLAAAKGREEAAAFLINLGASVLARDPFGVTPLHCAVGSGSVGTVRVLLAAGAPLDAKDCDGKTPVDLAAKPGREAVAAFLRSRSGPVSVEQH